MGNGTPISVNSDTSLQSNILVNLNGLSTGVHQLYIRTKDDQGRWSLTNIVLFDNTTIDPYRASPAAPGVIRELEYFIDSDPGFGLGTKVSVPASPDIAGLNVDIDISGLNEGEHIIYFRSLEDPWSLSAYFPLQEGSVLPVTWLYVKAVASEESRGITAFQKWCKYLSAQ